MSVANERVSVRRALGTSAAAKTVALVSSGVFSLLTARVLVDTVGADAFGFITMIAALASMLSFADLGIGAAVMTAVAERGPIRERAWEPALLTAVRALSVSAGVLLLFALPLAALGVWPVLFAAPDSTGTETTSAATAVLAIFAVTLPLSVGGRLLVGAGRNAQAILVQAAAAPLTFIFVLMVLRVQAPNWLLGAGWAVGALAAAAVGSILGTRRVGTKVVDVAAKAARPRAHRGERIRRTAVPMFIIMLVLPIATYADRIVLSHRNGLSAVADYSLAALLFGPLVGLVSATGFALWPWFAARRGRAQESGRELRDLELAFGAFGLLAGLGLAVAGAPVLAFVTGKSVPGDVLLAGGALVFSQALQMPVGMYLTDPRGLRFQALCAVSMAVVNLALSWMWAPWGAQGPLLATALSVILCQTIPSLAFTNRRVRAVPAEVLGSVNVSQDHVTG